MTTNPTRLDIIYARIDKEANKIAQEASGFYPDEDVLAPYNPKQVYHDQIRRYYKAGATPYGEQLAAAEDLIERIVGVINEIQAKAERGIFPHLPVETMGAQMCIEIDQYITDLFTPKQTTDDTANG